MARTDRPLHISEVTISVPGTDDRSRAIQAVLTILSKRPDLVARFGTPVRRELDAKMDAYFEKLGR